MPILQKPSATDDNDQPISPLVFIPKLMAGIVTPLELETDDSAFIEAEVTWLFHAIGNFLTLQDTVRQQLEAEREQVRQRLNAEERALIDRLGPVAAFVNKAAKVEAVINQSKPRLWQAAIAESAAVPVDIPPNAERNPQANNKVLPNSNDFFLDDWAGTVRANLKLITTHLTGLELLLKQERRLGPAGKQNIGLQSELKSRRVAILNLTQEMAEVLNHAYDILVTGPGQLAAWLEQN